MKTAPLPLLNQRIEQCERCPRLRAHCLKVANEKRKSFAEETYWGLPITGFGDPNARLVLVGLAPAAHGANRTGRIFTGDRSGDWLYRALHKAGFANQPTSVSRNDGLQLYDAWVTCSARCAPPENKPTREELENCSPFLAEELDLLSNAQVFVALGGIALSSLEQHFRNHPGMADGLKKSKRWKFSHGGEFTLPDGRIVLSSYHPSQQNTFTGRLTEPAFDSIFTRTRSILST
jgi:uracil-DNA glycosylase family 4